jgi:hypothetical protein
MSDLVYDYKSIAANMKGELAPWQRERELERDRGLQRLVQVSSQCNEAVACADCGSLGMELYCSRTTCPGQDRSWELYR